MPKPKEPESFETLGERYSQAEDRNALIHQVITDKVNETPTIGVTGKTQGNQLILKYHCYEQLLGERVKLDGLLKDVEKLMKEFVTYLKAEYKRLSGKTLKLDEDKTKRDYSVEKVSLNERYYFIYRQVFDLPE